MTTPEHSRRTNDQTAQDAGDLAELSKSLEARRDELDLFSRVAAHDLRAPLRSIEAFTQLAMEADDEAEATELLQRVLGAAGRMGRLLDSLLEFADSGQTVLEPVPIRLEEVARAAMTDLAGDIETWGATIDIGPLPSIEGDPLQLQRVFANLYSNAIRYSDGRPPHVEVRATQDASWVTVTVSDRGEGFSAEHSEDVFQPFRRFSSVPGGQGIGLTICRRIVERHGGRIWAESSPGEGADVSFTLPIDSNVAG